MDKKERHVPRQTPDELVSAGVSYDRHAGVFSAGGSHSMRAPIAEKIGRDGDRFGNDLSQAREIG
jgi:hypothetical protein